MKLTNIIIITANINPYFALGHANLAILLGVLFKLFSELFSVILIKKGA